MRSASSAPPGGDLGVVAREEHVGNCAALPFARAGIVRIFEQPVFEALLCARRFLAHHAGNEPHAGVEQGERGDLAARQHIVADRHLDEAARLDHPLVDALEARAEDDEARAPPPIARACACLNGLAARAHDQARPRIVRRDRRVEARGQHVGPHHHARAAARWRVVDRAMAAEPVLANVARLQRPQAPRQRFARQRLAERAREHGGKEGEDRAGEHRATLSALARSLSPNSIVRG